MIVRDGTDPVVEQYKQNIGITGDVYIDDQRRIESLQSHIRLLSSYGVVSTATTIEEAEIERAQFEEDLAAKRAEQAEQLTVDDTLEMLRELGVNVDDEG